MPGRLLDFIAFVRMVVSFVPFNKLMTLWPLPKWANAESTRQWAVKVLVVLDGLAEQTATAIDDFLVDAARKIADKPDAWTAVHSLIMDLVGTGQVIDLVADADGSYRVAADADPRITEVADDVGIPPAIIIMIVNLAIQAFKWWRNRNKEEPLPTPELPTTENPD